MTPRRLRTPRIAWGVLRGSDIAHWLPVRLQGNFSKLKPRLELRPAAIVSSCRGGLMPGCRFGLDRRRARGLWLCGPLRRLVPGRSTAELEEGHELGELAGLVAQGTGRCRALLHQG